MNRQAFIWMILVSGCTTTSRMPSPADTTDIAVSHDSRLQALELRLQAPATIRRGDSTVFRLVLRNPGNEPRSITLVGTEGQHARFLVTRPDGSELWNNLHGVITQATERTYTLQPGASVTFSARWDGRPNTPPGGRAGDPVSGAVLVRGGLRPTMFGPPIETSQVRIDISG